MQAETEWLTPYDEVVEHIVREGYHNHRSDVHSNKISDGLFHDMLACCPVLGDDYEAGTIGHWVNVRAPGGRNRFLDLFIGEPDPSTGQPDFRGLRIAVEHKSVITAHRNRTNRYDDLRRTLDAINPVRPEAIMVATVLLGTATRVLNVPDFVKKIRPDFEEAIRPRLSRGDPSLWDEFRAGISENTRDDPRRTRDLFRTIPLRNPGHTHVCGYDAIQIVPIFVDNVNPPRLERENDLDLDIVGEYRRLLHTICAAYTARWHLG